MTTGTRPDRASTPTAEPPIPPLENGDRLSREEFLRRAEAMTGVAKIERIEGIVYMQAALRFVQHGGPHARFMAWLGVYQAYTPGTEQGDNSTLHLDQDNDPQPDAFLRIAPECGGRSRTTEDGYIEGAAELVGEIAASSISFDLHLKLNVYRRNAVQEYIVWNVAAQEIAWFRLRSGQFDRLAADAAGLLKSEVFPGLWLDPAALTRGDMAAVLAILQQGLASPEHAAFVETLRRAGESRPHD